MQFNGIGHDHQDVHHITTCISEHAHYKKQMGQMGGAASSAGGAPVAQQTPQTGLTLSAWMDRLLGSGKRLLRGIWGSGDIASLSGETGDKTGAALVLAQIGNESTAESVNAGISGHSSQPDMPQPSPGTHASQIAAAASAIPHQTIQNDAHFAAVQDVGRVQETLWQKVRVKFKNIAGQLAGHLPGKFFDFQARNSFGTKQEPRREEMRRQRKPGRDRVDIGGIQMEESYLLDSYDRNGEYSRLSVRK